ncbi:DUF3300 domain-containing protein [Shewanella corallii]|uniref:DUF3300 domain-containing protein n=1 Tax=Shewanella corallii TaxID=560080 RepID=A0ABT0N3B9_9GAMM|nr:DUF3300 domain-containing protein [Shewanella corallii]MCL2912917.1 DUF3300 domain-containing protein [Shewanella corallii]
MLKTQSPLFHKLLTLLLLTAVLVMCKTDAFASEQQPSEARLAQLLAPVALYPDSLLTHILIASTYPLEIIEADRWRSKNKHLGNELLVERAEKQDWDPSVKALLPFPDVLERMSDELDWTSGLGDAFLANESRVLDMVQTLRQEADDAGNLKQMDNVTVTRVEREIIIESDSPQIVYVPYYDPRVVYPYWRWPAYPPVWWAYDPVWFSYRSPGSLFYWRPGIHISFNFFFGSVHWHNRHVMVHRHGHYHHRPHYRHRVATSYGAKRWHHNPHHRKGIRYANRNIHDRVYKHHNRVRVAEGYKQVKREFRQTRVREMEHRTRQRLDGNRQTNQYRQDKPVANRFNRDSETRHANRQRNNQTELKAALKERSINDRERRTNVQRQAGINSERRIRSELNSPDRQRATAPAVTRHNNQSVRVNRQSPQRQTTQGQSHAQRQTGMQRQSVQRSQVRPVRQAPRTVRSTPRSRPSGSNHGSRQRRH